MAIITDPDNLSQGAASAVSDAAWGSPSGSTVTITSAGNELPSISAGDYFEVRGHSDPSNNGLYKESGGSPSTGSITADKVSGATPATAAAEAITTQHTDASLSDEKSIFFDTDAREIYILQQGNVTTDGVLMQALYSFAKEEWKNDDLLIAFDFPFVAITPEQFEWVEDWTPATPSGEGVSTEKLIRTGGWAEIDGAGITKREWFGAITLGSFEDNDNDTAYYQFGTDPTVNDTVNFSFAGPVNEAVLTFEELGNPDSCEFTSTNTITRGTGDFVAEGYKVGGQVTTRAANTESNNGTFEITDVQPLTLTVSGTPFTTETDSNVQLAVDNRNKFSVRIRVRDGDPNGKTYDFSDLAAIGVTNLRNKVERFPLSNATDLKIEETDSNIDAQSPYTEILIRYLDQAFNREVDSTTKRSFGIIVDVGTYSRANGVSDGTTTFTSANIGTIDVNDFTNGTLVIHEGTDQGTHSISGTPTDNAGTLEVPLDSALSGSESNLSFTLQRSSPVVATAEEIYEKVQRELRQTDDIDGTPNTVIGRQADSLLTFVGDTLNAGVELPNNPNGGGSGVFIEGFDSNDTNRLGFTDNGGTLRNFPFVAAGTLNFNPNLVNDSGAKYWMYFSYTTRTNVSDLDISGSSGSTATISSSGSNLPSLSQFDYVNISGATNDENNGVWLVTDAAPSTSSFEARRISGDEVTDEAAFSATVDENPINSPGALIVQNNQGNDVSGTIGSASVGFDFDYDGNTQGGRTSSTDAAVTLRAIGLETGQFVETTGTITRSTGLSFSLVAGLERNYNNP